jgi:hypothetical protein
MSKELYMAAHEELIEEYLGEYPGADWQQAYEATADAAYDRMQDNLAHRIDQVRQLRKEGLL